MKLTVGPLAPAVYWRRRAVVLGVLLFVVFLIAYSCSGSDPSGAANVGAPRSQSPSPASPSPSASTVLTLPLDTEPSLPASGQPVGPPATGGPAAPGPCADADMSVVAVPDPASVKQGVATIKQTT